MGVGTTQTLHEIPLQVHTPIVTQQHSECLRFREPREYSESLPQSEALHVCLLQQGKELDEVHEKYKIAANLIKKN
jgi:hypothetical protein